MRSISGRPVVQLLRAGRSPRRLVIAGAHPTGNEEQLVREHDFNSVGLVLRAGCCSISLLLWSEAGGLRKRAGVTS